jgi:hypothetical protein
MGILPIIRKLLCIQTDRQTDRQAGRQAGRQTDRQADRQADRHGNNINRSFLISRDTRINNSDGPLKFNGKICGHIVSYVQRC